jgi:choice-of-anchor C domain-containing protein
MTFRLIVAGMATCMAVGAHANLIVNGSFETGADPGSFTTLFGGDTTSIPGWRVVNHSIDYIGTYWQADHGNRSIDLSGDLPGGVSQLVTGLTPNVAHILTFSLSGNPDHPNAANHIFVSVGEAMPWAASFFHSGAGTHANMNWQTYSLTFTPTANFALVQFTSFEPSPFGPALDNVSLRMVPGPAAALPFLVGLAGAWRRRTRSG